MDSIIEFWITSWSVVLFFPEAFLSLFRHLFYLVTYLLLFQRQWYIRLRLSSWGPICIQGLKYTLCRNLQQDWLHSLVATWLANFCHRFLSLCYWIYWLLVLRDHSLPLWIFDMGSIITERMKHWKLKSYRFQKTLTAAYLGFWIESKRLNSCSWMKIALKNRRSH